MERESGRVTLVELIDNAADDFLHEGNRSLLERQIKDSLSFQMREILHQHHPWTDPRCLDEVLAGTAQRTGSRCKIALEALPTVR
jgi:hypothetical protein